MGWASGCRVARPRCSQGLVGLSSTEAWERGVYKRVSRYLPSLGRLLGAQASARRAVPGAYLLYAPASCLRAPPCACGCLLGRVLSTQAGGRPGRSGWRDELPWRSASIPGLSKAAMSGHTPGGTWGACSDCVVERPRLIAEVARLPCIAAQAAEGHRVQTSTGADSHDSSQRCGIVGQARGFGRGGD